MTKYLEDLDDVDLATEFRSALAYTKRVANVLIKRNYKIDVVIALKDDIWEDQINISKTISL